MLTIVKAWQADAPQHLLKSADPDVNRFMQEFI